MGRASLKRELLAPVPAMLQRFPGPMGRASLKRQADRARLFVHDEISRPYGPGLIEAR